ncbi:MAG: 4-(cytidine 5'-diphospho)-2-C-methyl-D-erythritol kinase [Tepidanaerobacter acetatoxydans]|uniref:4-(cytidine 5'-diphospho)-2-C-methyl-D-erythritol kinase n=1 Tax=Tepidanaerobacter acetatoxydans TaxID=499229 RepID=UPI0026F13661|nr:4-(cytidine 5'-diphospho)-2-C-methyl-D-erythritol kinase [Tepidanaerobacter acetatoxydans]NLU10308.1 4-(cytidine 5'-diphospho)-2-C-methyl-D-erythritol kinase [Tepidanaerobacter acetatoxydans]
MKKLDIDARGKINLTLDVLFKRLDGYHEVEMIMQTIALKDIISIELLSQRDIVLNTNCKKLPQDESNLAYQAAELMMKEYGLDAGVSIDIHKNIPLAAGLAGGSSDAAAVIIGMNELFELKIPKDELMTLGKRIGADVPFCILGKTALARGIGEQLTPLKSLSGLSILLVKPPYCISTKEVYNRLDVKNIKIRPDTKAMIDYIEHQDIGKIASGLCNVLEEVTLRLYPELGDIKKRMLQKGALGSIMSGSGPSVFGIFENIRDAKRAADDFAVKDSWIFVTKTE